MSVYNVNRKIYLTRRTFENKFEQEKKRIDQIDNRDLVINWGNIIKETNYRNYDINNFNISPLILSLENSRGYFFDETRQSSLWYGYLSRIYSKIEILVGEDNDNLKNIYYGFIDDVKNSYDGKTYITVQPTEYILHRFSIKNLMLKGDLSCEEVLKQILENEIIKLFVKSYNFSLAIPDIIIKDIENIEGSYWDVIKYICLISNSYVYFNSGNLNIIPKTSTSGNTGITLYSQTNVNGGEDNIYSIGFYDDEGHKKIRLKFQEKNTDLYSVVKNANTLNKYLAMSNIISETEYVDLSNVKNFYKKKILDELVDYWGKPKKSIQITTKFNNEFQLLKTLKMEIKSQKDNRLRWGKFYWGDGSRWSGSGEGFVIYKKQDWIIKSLKHDLNNWKSILHLEEIF